MTQPASEEQEDWNEDEDYDEEEEEEEEEEEDDADIDAEALEIARRLGEELWADISKVNAERNNGTSAPTVPTVLSPQQDFQASGTATAPGQVALSLQPNILRKEEVIISTMKAILVLLDGDPLAKSTLDSTNVPNGPSVLNVLQRCNAEGTIIKGIAGPLSQIIVSLARSDILFANLKQSNASAIQLDKGKRKREEFDEGQHLHAHTYKRPYVPDIDLHNQVVEAVRVISQALGATSAQVLDPALVSSIRLQLHQVFLFAVTSSATGGPSMHALQEISGLIQVIGVLSGIQIGHSPEGMANPSGQPYVQGLGYSWNGGQLPSTPTDIGTAVYPCLVSGCNKTFSRLYSLRAHQRSHSSHRPYSCKICPASFARNHDLKRHIKLHDKKAWRCEGCQKIFSRRDAIKRHKNGTKNRGPKSEICLAAEVVEVLLEGAEGEDNLREERRAKLWNGIVVHEASGGSSSNAQKMMSRDSTTIDEGEINPAVIAGMQASVLGLHGLLQALVGNALGNPIGHPPVAPIDPSIGQATLASVIARAQSQNIPSVFLPPIFSEEPPFNEPSLGQQEVRMAGVEELRRSSSLSAENTDANHPVASLSMYGLSDEQTHLLEIAIANAASAAQAQAEAEAALEEEEEEDYDPDDNEDEDSEMEQDRDPALE
ncbi:hypothetical protein BDN70DRAFT_478252 [Pholiota conissans]|uniref:C2H2-type domain-containing protein n=1 Tax=Pholiota conissans TaxID=109636 RepID=A0A9P5YP39_9AGAR|nr:hypothetical protein BDN70DRAFT_478252 [Pholiota conissans]